MTKYIRMVRHGKVISCPIPDKFLTLDDFEVWATYHVSQGTYLWSQHLMEEFAEKYNAGSISLDDVCELANSKYIDTGSDGFIDPSICRAECDEIGIVLER